ncbi:hypothetical protein HID58_047393 [Brassica napus]|uniref:Uncharacterized protein n=1 Tax=Brassica napus TaxID=3708 RepID=A0ABQ8AZ40_BRANA|nr:hypothetical protein HID58_047393 [Brassica napus]
MAIDPSLSLASITGSFPFLSLDLCLSIVLLISLFVFWLTPGGFAWAIYKARFHTRVQSKTRAAIPGPAGHPIIGLLLAFVNNALTHRILANLWGLLRLRVSGFASPVEKSGILEHFVSEGYELLGIFNWSDHFPGARWLDLQGVRRRCRSLVGEVNVFVGNIIDDHISKRSLHDSQEEEITDEDDFVDVLLGMQGNSKLSNSDMIAVLWEMIFRGTDTVAILLEWILARMILHPDIQAKAQAEIDVIVGESGRQVSDLPKLPYLRAIVKETLRMHPPGPRMGSSHHSRDSDWDPLYSRWDHCYG